MAALPLVAALCVASCGEDEKVKAVDTPEILFVHSPLAIDLNLSSNPAVISVVNSETGLSRVETYIIKSGGVEEPFEEPVTNFFNPSSHSISYSPVYTEDMQGFKVVAIDRAGQKVSSVLPFAITALRNPPVVQFNGGIETIPYTEGMAMPSLVITITSEEDLNYLTLREVVNRAEGIIKISGADTLFFAPGTRSHTFDFADDAFQFKLKTTALKAAVGAGPASNVKVKVATLYVDFTYIPAPVVVYDQADPVSVNEFATLNLSGTITSQGGLTGVKYYTRDTGGNDTEMAGTAETFSPSKASHTFSVTYTNAAVNVDAIVIKATDALGKTTTHVKDITVVELAPPPATSYTMTAAANKFYPCNTNGVPYLSFNGVAKDSSIPLTGTITTEATLTSVTVTTVNMAGTATPESLTVDASNNTSFTLNKTIPAAENLARIVVKATDVNGKVTADTINVYVGFKFYNLLASGNGADNSYNTPCTCFFSAQLGNVYGYTAETKANADKMNVAFATWSSNTQMNIASITCSDLGTKMNHPTYGRGTWSDPVAVPVFLKTASAAIKRSTFDQATITTIKAETAPTGVGSRTPITGTALSDPLDIAIIYVTKIEGVDKRVVLCYDKFGEQKANASASTFWIKVKVEI